MLTLLIQFNGEVERWQKSLKADCIRPGTPLDLEQARHLIIGYVTPNEKLLRKDEAIFAAPDQKLAPLPGHNAKSTVKNAPSIPHTHSTTQSSVISNWRLSKNVRL